MGSETNRKSAEADTALGRKAVELGLITSEQLELVIRDLARSTSVAKTRAALADVLVARGHLSERQINILREATGAAPKKIGKYALVRELGRGGMGVVYEAEDSELGRRVALKTLISTNRPTGPDAVPEEEMFIREARLSANLPRHPNLVLVYEAGIIDNRRFIAMEYIDGQQFSEWRKKESVSLRQELTVLRDAALAVDHAHQHKIIHRDLKPANILVDTKNGAHVTDFGLAKRAATDASLSLTQAGMVVGTPLYMSPEQAQGRRDADHRTDVWSLGIMLYEVLAGKPPFNGGTPVDILMRIVKDPVPLPSTVARAPVDRGLEHIALKALAKRPKQRYLTAKAFADDLTKWLKGERISVVLPPREAPQRGWLIGGAAAVLLVAVVAGYAMSRPSERELAVARAEDLTEQGQRLLKQGKNSDAIVYFGRALAEDRNNRAAAAGKKEAEDRLAPKAPPPPKSAPAPEPPSPAEMAQQKQKEKAALESKRREAFSRGLSEVDTALVVMKENEGFGGAREFLSGRHAQLDDPEWREAVDARQDALKKTVEALYEQVKARSLEAKGKGELADVEVQRARVSRWKWGELAADLDAGLAKVAAPAPATAVASTGAEPARNPAPAGPDPAVLAALVEGKTLRGHQNAVNGIAYSPDGRFLVTSSYDSTVRLWDLPSQTEVGKWSDLGRPAAVAFSADGLWFSAAYFEGGVVLWDTASRKPRTLSGHGGMVLGVAFAPNSKNLASGGVDGTVRLWDTAGASQKSQLGGHPRGATTVAISPDGRYLVAGSGDRFAKLWDLMLGRELRTFEGAPDVSTNFVAFGRNGASIVTAGSDTRVLLWDVQTGRATVMGNHGGEIRGLAVSPDGRWAASAGTDNLLRIWDLEAAVQKASIRESGGFYSVAFSQKGDRLAAGTSSHTIRTWDIPGLAKVK